jgi:hypothetical protein
LGVAIFYDLLFKGGLFAFERITMPLAVNHVTASLATEMIAIFGDSAALEAANRAERFRDAGNAINFCNWRQAERLILLLSTERVEGTLQ